MTVQDLSGMQYRGAQLDRVKGMVAKKDEKLMEACRDFEALFVKQMLDAMRKTVEKNGLIEGGMAEDIFEDMLYDEYAKLMTKNAGLGVADLLYKQLSNL